MTWPPGRGDTLPRAEAPRGVREKLEAYCLNLEHEVGGPKAQAFLRVLGITREDVEHLAEILEAGIREAPVVEVRRNPPYGVLCEVRIAVRGLGRHQERVVAVTTAWELRNEHDRPRLVTAYVNV